LNHANWAKFVSDLTESKGINGKAKINKYIFQNISSDALNKSGHEHEPSILFEKAEEYIRKMLERFSKIKNFFIKELMIRDQVNYGGVCTINNDTFRHITEYLVLPRLEGLQLWCIDLSKVEDGEKKSTILRNALIDRIDINAKKIKLLELRLNRCVLNDDFSFIDIDKKDREDTKIKGICLSECGITDTSLDTLLPILCKHQSLDTVNLGNNNISEVGVAKIVEAFSKDMSLVKFLLHGNKDSEGAYLKREKVDEIIKDNDKVSISC